MPRGFGADEAWAMVDKARKVIEKKFPAMSEAQFKDYMIQVGAGRYMALAKYGA